MILQCGYMVDIKLPKHDILIVEDLVDIASSLEQAVMATKGLNVVGKASTLDQGLNMLFDLRPRIVLSDIGLPDGSGIDIIHACAAADWNIDTIVISIFGDEARVVQSIQAGAKGYILKGDEQGKIGDDILSVLSGGCPISPSIARHLLSIVKDVGIHSLPYSDVGLTERETEILTSIARGYKRHEIAQQLGIVEGTVNNHITKIYRKLEVGSNTEAVVRASRIGLL